MVDADIFAMLLGDTAGMHGVLKEVDEDETTIHFYQEICDEHDRLVELHEKYPVDRGHHRVEDEES